MKPYHQQSPFGLKRLIRSFQYAFRGLSLLFRFEYNLYIQIAFAFLALLLAFFFSFSRTEWAILVLSIGLVIFAELTNTAFEKTMDLVQPQYDERVRDIKDLAAGTVVFTVFISLVVGGFLFLPHFMSLFS